MFLRFSRSSKNSEVFGVLEVFEVCLSLFFQTNYRIDFCTYITLTRKNWRIFLGILKFSSNKLEIQQPVSPQKVEFSCKREVKLSQSGFD